MTGADQPYRADDRADPYRDWDASYVLGQLAPDERRAFERHLADCRACTTSVAELAGLPGILNALSAEEAVALLAPDASATADARLLGSAHQPDLVQGLARTVRRRRSGLRHRAVAILVGAGVAVALGGVLLGIGVGDGPEAAPAQAMSQVQPGWLDADLAVTEKGWGTRFDWNCSYRDRDLAAGGAPSTAPGSALSSQAGSAPGTQPDPPPYGQAATDAPAGTDAPTTYDLVVTDRSGNQTTVASWSVSGAQAGNLSASTSIPTSDIRSVDIRVAGTDQPLVRTTL